MYRNYPSLIGLIVLFVDIILVILGLLWLGKWLSS